MKKNLRKTVLLDILRGRNGESGDFLSEDMRPKNKPNTKQTTNHYANRSIEIYNVIHSFMYKCMVE